MGRGSRRDAELILPVAAVMIAVMTPAASNPQAAEAEIRALRAQSNAAIARHDVAGMRAAFLPDATVLPGSSGVPFGMDGFDARIGAAFADPTFVAWVRTPVTVAIGATGQRAAETGTWVGIWRERDGEMRVTGVYQAMWLPTPAGWRIKNESFVTLGCSGSEACAQAG